MDSCQYPVGVDATALGRAGRPLPSGEPAAGSEVSADGYELRFAVNHLAPFLLTNLLRRSFGGPRRRGSSAQNGEGGELAIVRLT
jgi:hypothetical protein